MRENSPFVVHSIDALTRVPDLAFGSKTHRHVGLLRRCRPARSGFSPEGGNQKNTLPSATVRSKTMCPSSFS